MIINKTQVTTMMTGRCKNMRDVGKCSEEAGDKTDCDSFIMAELLLIYLSKDVVL